MPAQSVSVSAAPSTITNEGEEAVFTLTISPPSSRQILLNFVMTGTAVLHRDYVLNGNFNKSRQVVIPPGQSTAMVTLHALYRDQPLASQSAIFNILNGRRYHVGSPDSAKVRIENQP
jgi:hypothetical protein